MASHSQHFGMHAIVFSLPKEPCYDLVTVTDRYAYVFVVLLNCS